MTAPPGAIVPCDFGAVVIQSGSAVDDGGENVPRAYLTSCTDVVTLFLIVPRLQTAHVLP